jgi:hypothetical protein
MVVPDDVLLDGFDAHTDLGQVFQPSFEICLGSAQLQDHETFLPRQNIGLENVETQVEILNQSVNDRLVPVLFGKMENDFFGSHGPPPQENPFLKYYT